MRFLSRLAHSHRARLAGPLPCKGVAVRKAVRSVIKSHRSLNIRDGRDAAQACSLGPFSIPRSTLRIFLGHVIDSSMTAHSEFPRVAIIGTGLIVHFVRFSPSVRSFPSLRSSALIARMYWKARTCTARSAKAPRISQPPFAELTWSTSRCRSERRSTRSPKSPLPQARCFRHRLRQHESRDLPRGTKHFRTGARFLGGHPMAGKENSGIDHADADLFRGSRYALIARENDPDPASSISQRSSAASAPTTWTDAETHDWAVESSRIFRSSRRSRWLTSLPTMTTKPASLSSSRDRACGYAAPRRKPLRNLARHMPDESRKHRARSRPPGSAIHYLRTHLATKGLEQEFRTANEIYRALRKPSSRRRLALKNEGASDRQELTWGLIRNRSDSNRKTLFR